MTDSYTEAENGAHPAATTHASKCVSHATAIRRRKSTVGSREQVARPPKSNVHTEYALRRARFRVVRKDFASSSPAIQPPAHTPQRIQTCVNAPPTHANSGRTRRSKAKKPKRPAPTVDTHRTAEYEPDTSALSASTLPISRAL